MKPNKSNNNYLARNENYLGEKLLIFHKIKTEPKNLFLALKIFQLLLIFNHWLIRNKIYLKD